MRRCLAPLSAATLLLLAGGVSAQTFEADVAPLVEASCVRCHGERTVTPLNLGRLGFDLDDHETFNAWEKVFDRLEKGEMPPAAAPKPDPALVDVMETNDEVCQGGFPAAAFTDHGKGFAMIDMERHLGHGVHPSLVVGRELLRDTLYLDNGTLAVAMAGHPRSPARLNGLGPS